MNEAKAERLANDEPVQNSGGLAWLASGYGPQIALAPEGEGEGGGDPPAGGDVDPPAGDDNKPPAGSMEPGVGDPPASNEPPAIDLNGVREQLAGGDEGFLKRLNRYSSLETMGKGWREATKAAQQKQQPLTLGDDASDDDVSAYREAMGIPAEAKDYPLAWRDGAEPSDTDTELLESFKNHLHESNVDPRAGQAAMDWYQDMQQELQQNLDANMAETAKETQATLRGEYGGEYDGNIAAANELMKTHMGEEAHATLLNARMQDGTRLQDNPDFVRMMVALGVDYYGSNKIFGGDVETTAKSIDEKLAEFRKMQTDEPAKYRSDAVQKEVAELYAQKKKLDERQRG